MIFDDINCCCAICDHNFRDKNCRLSNELFGTPNLMPSDCKGFKNFD